MNIYKILKLNQSIKSHRIKFLGLWLLSISNKRYLSIQFDPVLACNLRCKMCYFTDNEIVKKLKGIFKKEDLEILAKINYKNALRLQIGCGAEPTLFKHVTDIIKLGKEYKIPHISLITNGNLLTEKDVVDYSNAGLNEFILSMHGVKKESYENFMSKGDFSKFNQVLQWISNEKITNKNLSLRINYTFNVDNFFELKDFFADYGKYNIDTIQFRPIDKIGETEYNNFNLSAIENEYSTIIGALKNDAISRKITFLAPSSIKRDLNQNVVENTNNSSFLVPYTNFYVGPDFVWKDNFDWKTQTFSQWKKQNNWNLTIFKNIFISKKKLEKLNRNMLNYNVDIN